jgi:hypothetical protein
LLFWKHSSFENISLFQEANILLLPKNMNLYLLLVRERRLLSHLCQICLALLKVQQFWKYPAISGGRYPTAYRKHELIFIISKSKKAFVPFMSDLSCFTERTAVLKISRYFRRKISYCFQKRWSYFYYLKEKEGFFPIYVKFVLLYWKHSSFENISLFQEANILLLTVIMTLYL